MQYLALFRGINVGGKNKISMNELKSLFAELGFTDVITYINSGNLIFSGKEQDILELTSLCEKAVETHFGFHVVIAIINTKDYLEAIGHAPAWWGADEHSSHNLIMCIPPFDGAKVEAEVGPSKAEFEQTADYGQFIFWSAKKTALTRTRWARVTVKSIYPYITIRNINTARKLAGLMQREQ